MEHSRSPRWTVFAKSARTWISTCRGRSMSFSRYTAASPNDLSASEAPPPPPPPPPPARPLHQHGTPPLVCQGQRFAIAGNRGGASGHHRDAGLPHAAPRLRLVSHRPDRLGGRADENEPGPLHRLRERRPVGEEAVARVNGLGAGGAGRAEQTFDPEIALRGRTRGARHGY